MGRVPRCSRASSGYIDAMKMLLTNEPVDAEEALEVAPSYALAIPSPALQTTPALLPPASPIDRKVPCLKELR
jgi:hypothetical protein